MAGISRWRCEVEYEGLL